MNKELGYEYYNDAYKYGYDWSVYHQMGEHIIRTMTLTGAKEKKILDIGCGLGWFSDLMYFNVSKNVKGIDFSNIGINFHARKLYPSIDFEVASAYDYDFNGYDVFTAIETLEHLDDLKIIEKMPKGTTMYATVPLEDKRDCDAHLREYTTTSLQERFADLLDIRNVEIYGGSFIIFWGIRK